MVRRSMEELKAPIVYIVAITWILFLSQSHKYEETEGMKGCDKMRFLDCTFSNTVLFECSWWSTLGKVASYGGGSRYVGTRSIQV